MSNDTKQNQGIPLKHTFSLFQENQRQKYYYTHPLEITKRWVEYNCHIVFREEIALVECTMEDLSLIKYICRVVPYLRERCGLGGKTQVCLQHLLETLSDSCIFSWSCAAALCICHTILGTDVFDLRSFQQILHANPTCSESCFFL